MRKITALMVGTALVAAASMASADETWGDFAGYTLRVKLIGGAQYEKLYAEIPKWEAATGAEGLALAGARPPAVVLLDLGLPDGDGVDVARKLREWVPGTPKPRLRPVKFEGLAFG